MKGEGRHLSGLRHDLEAIEARIGPLLPLGRSLTWVPAYGLRDPGLIEVGQEMIIPLPE